MRDNILYFISLPGKAETKKKKKRERRGRKSFCDHRKTVKKRRGRGRSHGPALRGRCASTDTIAHTLYHTHPARDRGRKNKKKVEEGYEGGI